VPAQQVGILVHGSNHFIVRGRMPDRATALQLVQHWSVIRIGSTTPSHLNEWQISTKEFRENLTWAVVVRDKSETSTAVLKLLEEMIARGIAIHDTVDGDW